MEEDELRSLLTEMGCAPQPTQEQFERLYYDDWGEIIASDPDPVELIDRLAKLGTRLDDEGCTGGEIIHLTWDGEITLSGADAIWLHWNVACAVLPELRPELARAECVREYRMAQEEEQRHDFVNFLGTLH